MIGTKPNGNGEEGQIVLDQIRTVDKQRLIKKLGSANTSTQAKVLDVLREMFAELVLETIRQKEGDIFIYLNSLIF